MTKGKLYEFDTKALVDIGRQYANLVQACLRVFGIEYGHLQHFGELITERKISAYYLSKNNVNQRVITTTLNVGSWELIRWIESINEAMNEQPEMIDIFNRIEIEYQNIIENKS